MNRGTILTAIIVLIALIGLETWKRQRVVLEDTTPAPTEIVLKPMQGKIYEQPGLQRLPLTERKDHLDLVTKVLIEKLRCSFGDMEAIAYEMKNSSTGRLLVSLEPVDATEDRFKPIVMKTSVRSLLEEPTFQFSFAPPKTPIQLGLFICKDDDTAGRCNMKAYEDINNILSRYGRSNRMSKASDKIYFFQFLFLESPAVLTALSENRALESGLMNLAAYLGTTAPDSASRLLGQQRFLKVSAIQRKLQSVALKTEGSRVRLTLPIMDRACMPR